MSRLAESLVRKKWFYWPIWLIKQGQEMKSRLPVSISIYLSISIYIYIYIYHILSHSRICIEYSIFDVEPCCASAYIYIYIYIMSRCLRPSTARGIFTVSFLKYRSLIGGYYIYIYIYYRGVIHLEWFVVAFYHTYHNALIAHESEIF